MRYSTVKKLAVASSIPIVALNLGAIWYIILGLRSKPAPYVGPSHPTPGIVFDTNTNAPPIIIDGGGK